MKYKKANWPFDSWLREITIPNLQLIYSQKYYFLFQHQHPNSANYIGITSNNSKLPRRRHFKNILSKRYHESDDTILFIYTFIEHWIEKRASTFTDAIN